MVRRLLGEVGDLDRPARRRGADGARCAAGRGVFLVGLDGRRSVFDFPVALAARQA